MLRCLLAAATVFALTALLQVEARAGTPGPTVQYKVTDLGVPPGDTDPEAYGVNDLGQVTGTATDLGSDQHAFLYSDGQMTDLGTLPGVGDSYGVGINNSGQIAGDSIASGIDTAPWDNGMSWIYDDGGMTDIGYLSNASYLGEPGASVGGINSSGEIVGSSISDYGYVHAYIYSGGSMTDITPQNAWTIAEGSGINSAGDATGEEGDFLVGAGAFLYTGGTMTLLTVTAPFYDTVGVAINNSDEIVGTDDYYGSGTPVLHSFTYLNGAWTDIGDLGLPGVWAMAINNPGQVVGYAASNSDFGYSALFYSPATGIEDLNATIDPASGWVLYYATSISDNGKIVGYGEHNGVDAAFILTPLAKPALKVKTDTTTYYISATPAMPTINATVNVENVHPNPTETTSFTWTLKVHYNPKEAGNAHGPSKSIDYTWPVQTATGGKFVPNFGNIIRGGTLTLTAQATVNGQLLTSDPVRVTVLGTNPDTGTIEDALPNYVMEQIATLESGVKQFDSTGYPLWSADNLGGVGVMQVTNPAPTDSQVWDWTQNIAAGISKFTQCKITTNHLPDNIMSPKNAPGFAALVAAYNDARDDDDLPPLKIIVPPLPQGGFSTTPGPYEKNVIRYYNGAAGEDPVTLLMNAQGKYYLPEYTVATDSDGNLIVVNIDEKKLTGKTQWIEVDWQSRPNVGDPDYVNDVLAQTPP